MKLITVNHFFDPNRPNLQSYDAGDSFYEELISAHKDLSDEASQALNAKLVLLLANHVGDLDVLREAIAAAKQTAQEKT